MDMRGNRGGSVFLNSQKNHKNFTELKNMQFFFPKHFWSSPWSSLFDLLYFNIFFLSMPSHSWLGCQPRAHLREKLQRCAKIDDPVCHAGTRYKNFPSNLPALPSQSPHPLCQWRINEWDFNIPSKINNESEYLLWKSLWPVSYVTEAWQLAL